MRPRVAAGSFLVRIGTFIQSLAVVVMRPDDLLEFNRRAYADSKRVEAWGSESIVDGGLEPREIALFEKIPLSKGRVLVLDLGGGREAIHFAGLGFEVTGIDFIPEMAEKAKKNATKRGVSIDILVQEISELDVPHNSYDIVWLSAAMYSSIPARGNRIKMLEKIRAALKPGGYFALQFQRQAKNTSSSKFAKLLRKILAILTMGNLWHEEGDTLWNNLEFMHAFNSDDGLNSEFKEAGFETRYLSKNNESVRGEALLQKAF